MFNAPWPVLALCAVLIATHAARLAMGIGPDRFALTGADLASGRCWGLLTHIFVHASWTHVIMNTAFTLIFGVPVARLLGESPRGAAAFLIYFLACGVIAALAYAVVAAPGGGRGWAVVGASAAASGLFGGAARLIEGRGRIGPLSGGGVVGMSLAWIGINAVLGLTGLTPGAIGVPVAWQAHIFGFIAGLLLLPPAAILAGRAPPQPDHAPITR
jgi:membrane associated rhomboid family serine protease